MSHQALIPIIQPTRILAQLRSGQILQVRGSRGSAVIICHRHYADLVGLGAAVGGSFDIDCGRIIPIGNVSLVYPESRDERKKAYLMRQKWIGFTQKAMESSVPLQRARTLLFLLYKYFDPETIKRLPDEVLAQMVGVLPKTMRMARVWGQAQSEHQRPTPQKVKV